MLDCSQCASMELVEDGSGGRSAQVLAGNSDAVKGDGITEFLHGSFEQAVPVGSGELGDSPFERQHADCEMFGVSILAGEGVDEIEAHPKEVIKRFIWDFNRQNVRILVPESS